ncbi:unnamed protein product, partial [Discosporangium mesarthrocarpum]
QQQQQQQLLQGSGSVEGQEQMFHGSMGGTQLCRHNDELQQGSLLLSHPQNGGEGHDPCHHREERQQQQQQQQGNSSHWQQQQQQLKALHLQRSFEAAAGMVSSLHNRLMQENAQTEKLLEERNSARAETVQLQAKLQKHSRRRPSSLGATPRERFSLPLREEDPQTPEQPQTPEKPLLPLLCAWEPSTVSPGGSPTPATAASGGLLSPPEGVTATTRFNWPTTSESSPLPPNDRPSLGTAPPTDWLAS